MYALTRDVPLKESLSRHAPTLAGSMLIAELFYKLGSFTLECLAFLATWYVLDASESALTARFGRRASLSSD